MNTKGIKAIQGMIALLILNTSIAVQADSGEKFAIGVTGGTRGVGIEATLKLGNKVNLRGSVSQLNFDTTFNTDDIAYDTEVDLSTIGAMLDYYPFGNGFKVTAGYFNNASKPSAIARPGKNFIEELNGLGFPVSDELATVDITWDQSAPYVGIGWGNAFGKESKWSFAFELGVLFTGKPVAELTSTDALNDISALLGRDLSAELALEQTKLNNELNEFDKYPVMQLGLSYSF